jgi:Protein of unknown function (DUF3833)
MKKITFILTLILTLGGIIMMSSCTKHRLDFYKDMTPKADLKNYFTGPIKAWGIVQDWRGRVVNRFDIEMMGTWENDVGTLKEQFTYYDGKKQERIWTIKKLPDGTYEGTASDILNTATGAVSGSAVRWNYVMDLPVDGKTYRIKFDDWMWEMNDGVIINRSYLKKFGLTVAELTIFMQKQKP